MGCSMGEQNLSKNEQFEKFDFDTSPEERRRIKINGWKKIKHDISKTEQKASVTIFFLSSGIGQMVSFIVVINGEKPVKNSREPPFEMQPTESCTK